MLTTIEIVGLSKAEKAAQEILEHIEAIRKIQRDVAWKSVDFSVKLVGEDEEAASGN